MTNNTTPNAPAENPSDRITLEVDWADWEGTRPRTSDPEVLGPIIAAEIEAYVAEGYYPAGTRFEGLQDPGKRGTFQHPVIEISLTDLVAVFDFYTAYCGGDSMQAEDELEEFYGYTAPEGWEPKG